MKIVCEQHGRAGANLACGHVADLLRAGGERRLVTQRNVEPFGMIAVCTECAAIVDSAASEDAQVAFAESCRPVCAICLGESEGGDR